MKLFKYILLFAGVMMFTSCEDYFGEDANVDPDNPTVATANVILPQVQARLAYTYWGDMSRYVGIYTQHVDGLERQFAVIGQYGIVGGDVDATWSNIYSGTLNSNRQLYNIAIDGGFNHYAAISLALESYAMLISTDLWGDLPYSDAFKFAEKGVYSPTYDTQEAIYTAIIGNLKTARDLLAGDAGGSVPGGDDLMYGGDAGAWTKFCNVLEARAQLHLSKTDGFSYSDVMTALNRGGFDDSGDNASFGFGTPATETAPWYQYIEQRDDCEVGATYVGILESLTDPRLATYGQPHDNSHPVWVRDQSVNLLSYTEQEFIKAEALLGTDSEAAYTAYLNGIRSSMAEAKVSEADGMAYMMQANVGVGAGALNLGHIMTQKYIALYTDPEVFSDWRRTGMPALTPVTGTEIPRRLPYAESELFSNPDNTPSNSEVNIFSRVWWDK